MWNARTILTALCLTLAVPLSGLAANPYAPVRTINGEVITDYDIDQRIRLLEALGAEGDLRSLALEQLTEDRLKVQSGERIGVDLPEDAVLAGLEQFAASRGAGMEDVLRILDARDIDRQAMDDFVEAGLIWREVLGARFRQLAMPSDAEIDAALAEAANRRIDVYELGEIALPYAERGEAETQRLANDLYRELSLGGDFASAALQFSRAETASDGGRIPAMPLEGMPGPLRNAVNGLSPGQVAPPIQITGGIAHHQGPVDPEGAPPAGSRDNRVRKARSDAAGIVFGTRQHLR